MFKRLVLSDKPYFEGKPTKAYTQYKSMLSRCSSWIKRKDYKGSTVDPDWLNYQDWLYWANDQEGFLNLEKNGRIWSLDKDILKAGNKHYCPDYCAFIPNVLNQFFKLQDSSRDDYLLGVSPQTNKSSFKVRVNNGSGKHIYLGTYATQEEAHEAYLEGKTKLGESLADFYDGFVDDRVLEVVSDFKTWFKSLPSV